MNVVVESTVEVQLNPLTEQAASSNMRHTEIRLSLSALQGILITRMMEISIDRVTFMHINGLIANAKYDEEFNSTCPSIWEILKENDQYAAILSALRLEPLSLPYDSKVIPVSSDLEHPSTIILVTSMGSTPRDMVPGNDVVINTPQVAGDLSLDTGLEEMSLKDEQTSHRNDIVMVSSDDNVDVKDMPGLTKEQVDKSCNSGLPTSTSKAPSTVASDVKSGLISKFCGS